MLGNLGSIHKEDKMAVDIKKLIAAISPDAYCRADKRKEVKQVVAAAIANKEADAYVKAAELAEPAETDFMDFDEVIKTPFKLLGIKNPVEQHTVEYETSGQALEQVYFWLHDYLYNKAEYGVGEKLVDNFISSPGSAHFSEMGLKATKMQEEGMKIIGIANQIVRTILNIIYDLKEFKLRLDIYSAYNNAKDANIRQSAYLSLKQVWLDQVDIKRGNSSIKALAVSGMNQPGFVMLIDAFMTAESLEKIKAMDLNEQVKRILYQRFSEFERWLKESERELRKRFEIEKIYLKSQLNTVKLYARWAKPYLKAAAQLEQRAAATSALVTSFNTSLFELVLLGINDYAPEKDIAKGELPESFKGANKRKYASMVIVELKFRSIPERHQQGGYGFRGKAEVAFTSFSLNEDERKVLKEQLELDDFGDLYKQISGATEESLGQLQTDINEFLGDEKEDEKKKAGKASTEETNPFAALFSVVTDLWKREPPKPKKKEDKLQGIRAIAPDSDIEKVMRSQAGIEARRKCRKFSDSFKKANNSPAI